ncbi:MAG: leucyl aminopeptidase family protein [Pseudomonadales bacterium]|nr:leucyl aminopeptidase family protein [Pseudomonadales bacterium]
MSESALINESNKIVEIELLSQANYPAWLDKAAKSSQDWISQTGFSAKPGAACWVPDKQGNSFVLLIWDGEDALNALMAQPLSLPEGDYRLSAASTENLNAMTLGQLTLGWGLASYQFLNYKEAKRQAARLLIPENCDADRVRAQLRATSLVRDLINTPAADMQPSDLARSTLAFRRRHKGIQVNICQGEQLLEKGYRSIYTVGQASVHDPRLIDLSWGDPSNPKITLVGKGVCFDSGGLDLKPASGMRNMKKDMGGAAHVLGLAELVISQNLPIRLRVLIPAVENAVAGNAFRPGDIINSYKGLSVEVGNTDAEGRLVLSDALTLACEEKPELVIDFATLTGAGRVALGTDLPALFCNRDDVAEAILKSACTVNDPLWRLPLHQPYLKYIKGQISDLVNTASIAMGGAITAALFLEQFLDNEVPWVHLDLMAYNNSSKPGHPEGGEAMAMRALFEYLASKYV